MAPFITLFKVALSVDAILVHSNMKATEQVFCHDAFVVNFS